MIVHNITLSMFIAAKIIERAILEFADLRELFLVDLVEICLLLASPWPTTIYYDLKEWIEVEFQQNLDKSDQEYQETQKIVSKIMMKLSKKSRKNCATLAMKLIRSADLNPYNHMELFVGLVRALVLRRVNL